MNRLLSTAVYRYFPLFWLFFPYPSVVNRHSLLLRVRVKLGVEVNVRAKGPASSAGLVATSPYSFLNRARVCAVGGGREGDDKFSEYLRY